MKRPADLQNIRKIPAFYVPAIAEGSREVTLLPEEAHHAFRVMRLKQGEQCFLIDHAGHRVLGEVVADNRIQVLRVDKLKRPFGFLRWMVPFLPIDELQHIVEAATFFGVERVHIVQSEYSKPLKGDAKKRVDKLEHVVLKAQKIAQIPYQPRLEVLTLEGALQGHQGPIIVFYQHGEQLQKSKLALRKNDVPLLCFGPEGGYSDKDITYFKDVQATFVSLGKVNFSSKVAPGLATAFLLGHFLRSR